METRDVSQLEDFFQKVWAVICFEPKPNQVTPLEADEEGGKRSITVEVVRGTNRQRLKGIFSNPDICLRAHIGLRRLIETAKIK